MSSGMTLTIPRQLYERVQHIAQKQQRNVDEVAREALEQVVSHWEVSPVNEEKEREKEAFRQLHAALLEKYAGEYVAISGEKLVDHDVDRAALFTRIEKQYPNRFVLIRPVRQKPEIVYRHRSLRWE